MTRTALLTRPCEEGLTGPHPDQGTVFAGEIKNFDPELFMTKKMARRVDPYIAYMIVAAKKALKNAGLPFDKGEELADALVGTDG